MKNTFPKEAIKILEDIMESKKKKYEAEKKKHAKNQQTLNFWQMNLKFIF